MISAKLILYRVRDSPRGGGPFYPGNYKRYLAGARRFNHFGAGPLKFSAEKQIETILATKGSGREDKSGKNVCAARNGSKIRNNDLPPWATKGANNVLTGNTAWPRPR